MDLKELARAILQRAEKATHKITPAERQAAEDRVSAPIEKVGRRVAGYTAGVRRKARAVTKGRLDKEAVLSAAKARAEAQHFAERERTEKHSSTTGLDVCLDGSSQCEAGAVRSGGSDWTLTMCLRLPRQCLHQYWVNYMG